ncbi:MAG: pantoate--beta-alanine ligase [Planctomycetota bacterium]|nr:pantoate--beta-alanine ligase [Planctomycetota bacterium]
MSEETIHIARTRAEVQHCIQAAREGGKRLGLVPTMGALHEGHLSLVRAAQRSCDFVVVTIFVNPAQFSPTEDFSKYPRTIDADLEALRDLGVDLVFMPDREELYPGGFSTYVLPPAVADPFEGQVRPGHFRGVATIILKLFHLLPTDVAFFGQKDYQQCQVIRQMVEDLNVPIEIQACPIIREPDGLAMSSRNRYLSPDERRRAVSLSAAVGEAVRQVQAGTTETSVITERMHDILRKAGVTKVDYAAIADATTLEVINRIDRPAVALIAAYVGATRLIDNALLTAE